MIRALLVTALLGLLAFAQAPKPPRAQAFATPDGHWWLAANAQERDGFVIGYYECQAYGRDQPVALLGRPTFEDAITRYYQSHSDRVTMPVVAAINALDAAWKRTGAYRFVHANPRYEYDGEMWREGTAGDREGMIRGFLACQAAEQGTEVTVPVAVLVQRVSAWYGIDPNDESIASDKTVNDKLGPVILRAEREGH